MNKISVIIADDHPIVRHGIKSILENSNLINVIAEAENGEEAIKHIKELSPEIAILDMDMPKMTGLEVIQNAVKCEIKSKFIIITAYKDETLLQKALSYGVSGFLLKENALVEIILCVQKVYEGKSYISSELTRNLIHNNESKKTLDEANLQTSNLTLTEKKILKLVASNKTSKEIAEELFVSYRTVENHRSNICKKLNLFGGNALLRFALENKSKF